MKQRRLFCNIMKTQKEKYVEEYIISALFKLMERKTYESISITEITNKAGVGRISFYRNFDSKEDIVKKWIHTTTEKFLQDSNLSYKEDTLEEYFTKLFIHLNHYKKETSLIYQAGLIHLLKDEFESTFFKRNKTNYEDYKSYFIIGGIFNIYYYWLINRYRETPQELTSKLVDLLAK